MKYIYKIYNKLKQLHKDESGSAVVEMATMFPVILIVAMFLVDNNIKYAAKITTASSTSEALRFAITEDSKDTAVNTIKNTLTERFQQQNLGWCSGKNISSCKEWGSSIRVTDNLSTFQNNKNYNLYIQVDDKGWCSGSYVTVAVRTHKASALPVYESYRSIVEGGRNYQIHTYGPIKARIQSNELCS